MAFSINMNINVCMCSLQLEEVNVGLIYKYMIYRSKLIINRDGTLCKRKLHKHILLTLYTF